MAQWLSSIPQTQVKNHMGWHPSIIPELLYSKMRTDKKKLTSSSWTS